MADRAETGEGVVVVVPTYNERENVGPLLDALAQHVPAAGVLIVDDNSPDGTADVVAERARADRRVHLRRRPGKEGLGAAYRDGLARALAMPCGLVAHMDCDFSHDPADLPRLLAASDRADLVIGSRYVPGGGTEGWPWRRRLLSRAANLYARSMLRLPVRDLTGGFKCWRRAALETVLAAGLRAEGYVSMVEMTWQAIRAGFGVLEVPILFRERQRGTSKMGLHLAIEGLRQVLAWSTQPPPRRAPSRATRR